MKRIVMTTETDETVTMGEAGQFRTGVPVEVADDALADALLKRVHPTFEEVPAAAADEPAKPAKKVAK